MCTWHLRSWYGTHNGCEDIVHIFGYDTAHIKLHGSRHSYKVVVLQPRELGYVREKTCIYIYVILWRWLVSGYNIYKVNVSISWVTKYCKQAHLIMYTVFCTKSSADYSNQTNMRQGKGDNRGDPPFPFISLFGNTNPGRVHTGSLHTLTIVRPAPRCSPQTMSPTSGTAHGWY